MRFRPCIDIHNGKVKQIVGGTLTDEKNAAKDNYVSEQSAGYYAELYKSRRLTGGHIILLNPVGSEYYEADVAQAREALGAWPGGFMVGGGINPDNATRFLDAGASHVIVTSYVFKDGKINVENLNRMVYSVGKERLVLDLSARKKDGKYYIVTDRWQNYTDQELNEETLEQLSENCAEYLVHAVDVEGKVNGIETEVVRILGTWGKKPATYAGGVATLDDLTTIRDLGRNKVDVTVGSALDLFGGSLPFTKVCECCSDSLL